MLKPEQIEYIYSVADKIVEIYKNKKKQLSTATKGFASDALHFAAEMVARFEKTDRPRSSITLSESTSIVGLKI